ncbi:unnamed protein product [Orchesella dallaii]|uniref:Cytochrome P450 n=1 Tax=Orchesella dallaii TaxID=48710 RepID=A0ABP1S674_9HEXA
MWAVLILLSLIVYLLHKCFSKTPKPSWWKDHGIPEIDPSTSSSLFDIVFGNKSMNDRDDYTYNNMGSNKFCGVIESPTPIIFLKDLDLIKNVLIKDFDHFTDRRHPFPIADKTAVFSKNLGDLQGDEWKNVRQSVSPTFTTGKMRKMMEHFNSVGQEWIEMLQSKAKESSTGAAIIDANSCINQYTIEVIANAVFGMNTGTIQNPNSIFAQKAARIANMDKITDMIKMNLSPRYPKIFTMLGIEMFDKEGIQFFTNILRQSLEARLKGEVIRNDFQQLLIDARKGVLKGIGSDELDIFEKDAEIKSSSINKEKYLTDDIIIAQSLVFFLAGLTGVSNTIAFAAYALALQPDIQERLREEVGKVVKEDGSVDYDDLTQLTYLDMVVCEVLRKFPGMFRLERVCEKDYHDTESGLFVPKKGVVIIPVHSIHNDPKYYEYPEKFYPEHFTPEKKAERSPYAFQAFGVGPRNCIGMRFALIESKAVIAKLVHYFRIEPTEKTPSPLQGRVMGALPFIPADLELKLISLK